MAIFNKDGKVYILEGPNPLVKKQATWDPSKLVFHNFEWSETVSKGHYRTERTKRAAVVKSESPVAPAPIAEQKTVSSHEQDSHQENTNKSHDEETKSDFDLPHIKHKVLSYCLPANVQRKTDKFYGESWMKVTYGKKIIFPSVMTEVTDFGIEFWTSDPNDQITEKSIVYPFVYEVYNSETGSYDRVPYDEYRWWKISEKKKMEEGGWLFKAEPSDVQPDFSGD